MTKNPPRAAQMSSKTCEMLQEAIDLSADYLQQDQEVYGLLDSCDALIFLKTHLPAVMHPHVTTATIQSFMDELKERLGDLETEREQVRNKEQALFEAMQEQEPALQSLPEGFRLQSVFAQIATFDPYKLLPTMCVVAQVAKKSPVSEATEVVPPQEVVDLFQKKVVARPTLLARLKARGLQARRNTSSAVIFEVLRRVEKGQTPRQICHSFPQMKLYNKV